MSLCVIYLFFGAYHLDMIVVGGRYPDEIHYRIVWYGVSRILFTFLLTQSDYINLLPLHLETSLNELVNGC